MHNSGAALGMCIENEGQCTHFDAPYHLCFLVVSSMHKPLLSAGREGGGSDGSDPTFLWLVRRATPFSMRISGVGRRSPRWGSLPSQ